MILLLFLCVNLSVLHLCVSDLGYQCKYDDGDSDDSMEPKIFLIQENNASEHQKTLNEIFSLSCRFYYDIAYVTLKEANPTDNIIHFAVPDYYDGKPLGNFVYAGNMTKDKNVECTKYACHEIANLVSKSIEYIDDGQLYSFVQKLTYDPQEKVRENHQDSWENHQDSWEYHPQPFVDDFRMDYDQFAFWRDMKPFRYPGMDPITIYKRKYAIRNKVANYNCRPVRKESPTNLMKVLLCIHGIHKEVNIKPLTLIQAQGHNCNQYLQNENLLAVLIPGPKGTPESLVPTIFYETPYLDSEELNVFPNSMNLVPWRLLKYGFLKFIQKVGWQRVAIVSDDSEYSIAFEEELVALFKEEKKIIYTVIRCENAKYDIRKIAKEINRATARVVIANVELSNAAYLIRYTNRWITWLYKEKMDLSQYLDSNQIAFAFEMRIDSKTRTGCNVGDNVLTSLSSISQAYNKKAKYSSGLTKREFYRRFADEVRKVTPKITKGVILVHKAIPNKYWSETARMSVNESGAEIISYADPFENEKPSDGTAHCLLTSYNFYKPCDDILIVVVMFIAMTFVITLGLITCYFDNNSPYNDPRYHNF